MKSIPNNAFEIVAPDQEIEIQGLPENQMLKLESTPGHTPDHITPTLYNEGTVAFMHLGEAAGTLMHASDLVTLGTSMPPEFHFDTYISSLKKIIEKQPANIGLGHFGVVLGKELNKAASAEFTPSPNTPPEIVLKYLSPLMGCLDIMEVAVRSPMDSTVVIR